MFNNANKKNKNTTSEAKEGKESEEKLKKEISENFVTHQMPAWGRFSGQTYSSKGSNIEAKAIMAAGQPKKTGLVLVIIGVLLLIAALGAAYWFIIKPSLEKPSATPSFTDNNYQTPSNEPVATTTEPKADEINDVATTTPTTDETASSTDSLATSTDVIVSEDTPVVTSPLVESPDSDNDGLTDAEERVVGTDPENADTDNDGYSDYQELLSGYDPLVPKEKLGSSSTLGINNLDGQVRALYPADWSIVESPSTYTVVFSDSDQAFIQASYQNNDGALTPGAWLVNEIPGAVVKEFISGEGWTGFILDDGLSVYVFSQDDKRVYTITCLPLAPNTDSPVVFNLMLKTLIVY